jgi:SAM-dependent methyltransferase
VSKDKYRLSFDGVADLYERTRPTYAPDALAFLEQRLPLGRVLDLGAGTGQAFHWFDPAEALAEMHRVLRPGGGYALLWNRWDDDDPLLRELDELIQRLRPEGTHDGPGAWEEAIVATPFFGPPEEQKFSHTERLDVDMIVGRVASVSAVAAASPEEQARVEAQVRTLVTEPKIDFPMITGVVVADRV